MVAFIASRKRPWVLRASRADYYTEANTSGITWKRSRPRSEKNAIDAIDATVALFLSTHSRQGTLTDATLPDALSLALSSCASGARASNEKAGKLF